MALLRDILSEISLELVPVVPFPSVVRDAYDVRIRRGLDVVFYRQYSVYGKQMGHYYVRQIARAFRAAATLRECTLPISIGDSGDPDYNEAASLQFGTDWIYFVMHSLSPGRSGEGRSSATSVREIVSVDAFVRRRRREDRSNMGRTYTGVFLACDMQGAVEFGQTLYRELLQAQRLRAELGLEAPGDLKELLTDAM